MTAGDANRSTPDDARRWQQVKALFEAASGAPHSERAALVEAASAGDAALAREVHALLDASDFAEAALAPFEALSRGVAVGLRAALREAGPDDPAADTPAADTHDPGGAAALRVGPYRLVRRIGQGGMGTVFLAERADGQFAQRVALKLVRAGAATPAVQQRFRAERQILARLRHPGIARLLDGGVTPPSPDAPDGLPYLVMEYVPGEPLLAYCDRHRLRMPERLRLFLAVCDAVQSAHEQLVVHRDIKPSNILVEGDAPGRAAPRLIDFGIAKVLAGEREVPEGLPGSTGGEGGTGGDGVAGADEALTAPGVRLLTPEYAAPEQLAGEPVTTATDVYALGVVLFELLAGIRPPSVRDAGSGSGRGAGVRPSTAALQHADAPARADARGSTPERLARALRGDLDTIVQTARDPDPARRYGSAAALADDLRRHLARLPLRARPPSAAYLARRFVQRHRAGVGATLLVVLALATGLLATLAQARHARLEAGKAQATLTFLQNTLYAAAPDGRGTATIRAALDTAALHVARDLAAQPLVAAGVHSAIGYVYFGLGEYAEAERHHRRGAALYRAAGGQPRDLGVELLNLGHALAARGRASDAVAAYEEARPLLARHGTDAQRASLFNGYAAELDGMGRREEAEPLFLAAIEASRAGALPQLPLLLGNLAVLYESTGRAAEAIPLVEEAAAVTRAQGEAAAPHLSVLLGTLGTLYSYAGRPDEARQQHDAALALARRAMGPDHPRTTLAAATRALVAVRDAPGPEATAAARAAWDAARALPPESYIRAHAAAVYAQALCDAAAPALGDVHEGEALARYALATRAETLPADHVLLPTTESVLGGCLAARARLGDVPAEGDVPGEARARLTRAYAVLLRLRGPADPRTRDVRHRLRRAL